MAKNKDYNRPNLNWECGWAKEGKACPKGPTPEGHCHTTQECDPKREGDRWACARLPQRGGKCAQGPNPDGSCCLKIPPCQPRRSLRSKRALASFYVFAASVGLVLIGFGARSSANHFFSPGPLSNHHRSVKHECSTCHGGEKDMIPAQWLVKSSDPHLISKNCQSCHSKGEFAFDPHGMKPDALKGVTLAHLGGPGKAKDVHAGAARQMECATCHKEHNGMDAKLTSMSSQQCQTCHVQKFSSFASGHPEFSNFPFQRRTRILFDHNAHFGKYFSEKQQPNISCTQCHVPEPKGQHMALKGFEQSCATCHEPAIRGVDQTAKGIAFWRLPTMDLKSLAKSNIGPWPEDADGKLTPYQKLLLAGDERFANAMKTAAELDLGDLSSASPEELKAAATIAWGVKAMMKELASEGGGFVKTRLEKSLGRTLSDSAMANLMGSLPVDMLRATSSTWFRNLSEDLAGWEAKKPRATTPFTLKDSPDAKDEAWTESGGGWYRKSSDFTVRLRPRGHADPFVTSWLGLVAGAPQKEPALAKVFDGLVDPKSPGSCVKCHTVDQDAAGNLSVNWHAKNRENTSQGFVKFEHSAHFSLLDEKGCMTCHTLDPKAENDKNTSGRDPNAFSSSFMPIKKESCLSCHSGDRVDTSCASCHNYHVDGEAGQAADYSRIKTKL